LRDKKNAESVRETFVKAFYFLPVEPKKSLTHDKGKEMSERQRFTIDTGIMVFFAHPSSPRKKGTNENANGLLRQYLQKETDFANISTGEIERVQGLLNDRPRAILSYLKPDEVINVLVALKI
jgi:IS30 family transposase